MRMTASWFRSLDLPHTRLWRDSTAPESGLPSDCHPDCIIVLEAVRMRLARSNQETDAGKNASPFKKPHIRALVPIPKRSASPRPDVDTAAVVSLKVLDPNRPIREADIILLHPPHCTRLGKSAYSDELAFRAQHPPAPNLRK